MPVTSAALQPALDRLASDLRAAAGANLLGVALYGGLAKGRFTPGISDVNILVILQDAGLESLEPLAPVLTGARRAHQVTAFIATPGDLRDAARLFPVKIRDIQVAHRILFGDVGLGAITVEPAALRLRARQELRNLHFRLRQRVVERGADPDVAWGGLVRSLPKLAVTLEVVLRARDGEGSALPADRPSVLRGAAAAFAMTTAMEPFARLHRHEPRPDDATVRRLFGEYLQLLEALSGRLERDAGG